MRRDPLIRLSIGLLVVVLLAGCGPLEQRLQDGTAVAGGQQVGTQISLDTDGLLFRTEVVGDGEGGGEEISDTDALATQVQGTLNALATNTPTNTIVPPPDIPTATIATLSTEEVRLTSLAETLLALETGTATPSATPTATVTNTPGGPTNTPGGPTNTPATSGVPCLAARFVADVTYPPNSIVQPSTSFFKSWQVQNVGSCTWNGDFAMVWYDGFQLNGTTPLRFGSGVAVRPGGYVTLTIQLWTPPQSGTYTSLWMLSDDDGTLFGTGAQYNLPLQVRVIVPGVSPPEFTAPASTPPPFYTNTPGP